MSDQPFSPPTLACLPSAGSKVYADKHKERTLRLASEWDEEVFVSEMEGTHVRMSWLGRLRPEKMGPRAGARRMGQERGVEGRKEGREGEEGKDVGGNEAHSGWEMDRANEESEEGKEKEGREEGVGEGKTEVGEKGDDEGGWEMEEEEGAGVMEEEEEEEEEKEGDDACRPVVGFRPTGRATGTRRSRRRGGSGPGRARAQRWSCRVQFTFVHSSA